MIQPNRSHGGRYLSEEARNAIQRERREAIAAKKMQQKKKRIASLTVLIFGNALMLAMILNGLIDSRIGMAALICISYGCGKYGR